MAYFSIIIPVYNRPDEVDELLDSLTRQTCTDFEVVIVDDGSTIRCDSVAARYNSSLDIHYYYKPNEGPGPTRNYGAERSHGEYLIILDSDCVLPTGYLQCVADELHRRPTDAFGGPDRAHPSFSPIQKAISYAMTSFITTGGIRGGKNRIDKFYPRSFNMGLRARGFSSLGGFSPMRFGEDIDLSIRIFEAGHSCRLFPDAWVWHKRRTDLKKFFKQVHNSGIARINLYKRHPQSLKPVHLLPMLFTVGCALLLIAALTGWLGMLFAPHSPSAAVWRLLSWAPLLPLLLFALVVGIDASATYRSLKIGALAILASFVQLIGYGTGFLRAWWLRCVCGRDQFAAFEKNFYK